MKLRRLDLIAFGPFRDGRLDFAAGPGVIDLVYGPNEAGKSTTLRAISGLLFGIPERTKDAHRHAASELRVGGLLEAANGARLEIVRRKGRKATLRAPDDSPLEESILSPLLQGATQELFEGLFGLDHERLRESAQALLAGKGSVGESLFAAGVGGSGIHELSLRLSREAEELFLPRARERKVTRAIAEVKDARDVVRQAATSPSKYLEQQRSLDDKVRARDALRARRTALASEQARLSRVVQVLPGLRRHAELGAKLAALGVVVELPADARERRARALRDSEDAQREEARTIGQEAELEQRLATIVFSESLLHVDETKLLDWVDRRGRFLSAELDRPKLEAKAIAIEASVARSLSTIGAAASAEELHVSVAGAARVRHLATRRQRLDDKHESARRRLTELTVKRAHLVERLSIFGTTLVPPAVFDGHASVAAPTAESVARFDADRAALDESRARASRDAERAARAVRDVERRLALEKLGDVPTEQELRSARDSRDALWSELRSVLSKNRTPAASAFDGFESAVGDADKLADRLRREADRVALLATLETERHAAVAEVLAVNASAERVAAEEHAFEGRWRAAWQTVGIAPRAPSEMIGWVRDLDGLVRLAPETSLLRAEVEESSRALEEWQTAWSEAASALGLRDGASEEEAFAVLDAMTQLVRQVEEAVGLRRRVEGIERDSARFAADVAQDCRTYFPGGEGLEAADASDRLILGVKAARSAHAERARLESELARVRRTRVEQALRRKEAEASLRALMAAAHVTTPELLEEAESRAANARALRDQIYSVEDELRAVGDGVPLDVLAEETRAADLDRTRARLEDIALELDELTKHVEQANQDIGSLEHGVHSMGHTDAAEASAVLEDRVAVLQRRVHRYVRVRLASVLLDREIERYREANQGPIVARANELFPRLTSGRYSGVRVGYDADGRAVLLGVRADGSDVGVEGLSDGTRDQLYLALRLSSLERYARANEPMPLVLDDVLIHLDDTRASAALVVLGEIAKTTQVIFFTHHARLVELARAALGSAKLAEHELKV